MATRPEPTIFGNCDSWNFIVGKKPYTYSRKTGAYRPLQHNNENLCTAYQHKQRQTTEQLVGDLWIACEQKFSSRNVNFTAFDMPIIAGQVPGF